MIEDPERKRWMPNVICLKLITIPPTPFFIDNGFLEHEGANFAGKQNIRFYMYLISQYHPLKGAFEFPMDGSSRGRSIFHLVK